MTAGVLAAALAASPALACRRPLTPPPSPALPDDRVAFIATIDTRGRTIGEDREEISALLRVQQRLRGQTRDFVAARASVEIETGREESNDALTEVVIVSSCGRPGAPRPDFAQALADTLIGSELIVLGRQVGGRAVEIVDLAPLDSPRGRELLAEADRP